MVLGHFLTPSGPRYGLVIRDRWLDIPAAARRIGETAPERQIDFVAGGDDAIAWGSRLQAMAVRTPERFGDAWQPLRGARYLPPFAPEGRLFTQRGNACLFSRVIRLALPEHPVFERRYTFNLVGHNHVCDYLGHGANPEFVAVIGAGGRDIPPSRVMDHIFGYTLMIDHPGGPPVFLKDWGMEAHREAFIFRDHMFMGSYFANTCAPTPVGPWIVTRDEIRDPYDLWISAEEDCGMPRVIERVSTGASLFRFEDTFSFMSRLMTLKPGDMLSSSSIGYDGYGFWEEKPPGAWFQATCEGIGSLRMYLSPPGTEETPA
jgi:hypothetical protein